jgi:predicted ArsR family transcriptional regulator
MRNADRHSALADPTRRALLDALREAAAPLGVGDLAGTVGLHPNSVREQMRRLEAAGLVRVSSAEPSGRGRPGLRFVLTR